MRLRRHPTLMRRYSNAKSTTKTTTSHLQERLKNKKNEQLRA